MRAYVDHVLALLPFEPEAYRRLRGPPCSYVGHPLTEQLATLRPGAEEQKRRDEAPPVLLVLPGSRRSEIRHHMAVFGETLARLQAEGLAFELILPTMPHLLEAVARGRRRAGRSRRGSWSASRKSGRRSGSRARRWPSRAPSRSSLRSPACRWLPPTGPARSRPGSCRRVIQVKSVILANLVIGENVVPEFIQQDCTAEKLCARACARCWRTRRRGGGSSRRLRSSTASCRPATSRRACARPTSCWRRCGRRADRLARIVEAGRRLSAYQLQSRLSVAAPPSN